MGLKKLELDYFDELIGLAIYLIISIIFIISFVLVSDLVYKILFLGSGIFCFSIAYFKAVKAVIKAAVPELVAIQYFVPIYFDHFFSNS